MANPNPQPTGRENIKMAMPVTMTNIEAICQLQSIQLKLLKCSPACALQLVKVKKNRTIVPRLRKPVTRSPSLAGFGKFHSHTIHTRLNKITARSSGGKKRLASITFCQASPLHTNKTA